MPYTAMPAWPQFSEQQLTDLVYYVKSFAPDFAKAERQAEPILIPPAPSLSKDSIEKGKKLYADLGCARCHGDLGRTDGISAPTLKDDWGNTIRSADLTRRWTFRGGPKREDIFRAFSTGLNGTPMPSFVDALSVEQRWDLANYIYSLSESDTPSYATVVMAKKVQKEIDLERCEALRGHGSGVLSGHRSDHPARPRVPSAVQRHHGARGLQRDRHRLRAHVARHAGGDQRQERSGDRRAGRRGRRREARREGRRSRAAETSGAKRSKPLRLRSPKASVWGEEEAGAGAPAAAASEFSDAVAIQLPVALPTTIRKPYFIFGDKGNPVNLWFADLAKKTGWPVPRLKAATASKRSGRASSRSRATTTRASGGSSSSARCAAKARSASRKAAFVPVAFSVWDGLAAASAATSARSPTGGRCTSSPAEKQSPAGQMAEWAVAAFALELAFIGWARRRARRSTGAT